MGLMRFSFILLVILTKSTKRTFSKIKELTDGLGANVVYDPVGGLSEPQ